MWEVSFVGSNDVGTTNCASDDFGNNGLTGLMEGQIDNWGICRGTCEVVYAMGDGESIRSDHVIMYEIDDASCRLHVDSGRAPFGTDTRTRSAIPSRCRTTSRGRVRPIPRSRTRTVLAINVSIRWRRDFEWTVHRRGGSAIPKWTG